MVKHFPHEAGARTARLERAQTIGLQGLTFLLSEPTQLARFLNETGLSPNELRSNAQAPEVLEAALTVLVNDEALLLTFAANAGLAPAMIVEAHAELASDGGQLQPPNPL